MVVYGGVQHDSWIAASTEMPSTTRTLESVGLLTRSALQKRLIRGNLMSKLTPVGITKVQSKLRPVTKISISEEIAQQIMTLISNGDLKTGQRLPSERELCKNFGCGRSSLREGPSLPFDHGCASRTRRRRYICSRGWRQVPGQDFRMAPDHRASTISRTCSKFVSRWKEFLLRRPRNCGEKTT